MAKYSAAAKGNAPSRIITSTSKTAAAKPYTFGDYLLELFPSLNSTMFTHLTNYFAEFFTTTTTTTSNHFSREEMEAKGGKLALSAAAAALTTRLRIEQNGEQCLYLQLSEVHRRHHYPVGEHLPATGINGGPQQQHSLELMKPAAAAVVGDLGPYMYPCQGRQGQQPLMMAGLEEGVPLHGWARLRRCADCDLLLKVLYQTRGRQEDWWLKMCNGRSSGAGSVPVFRFPVALYHRLEKVLGLLVVHGRAKRRYLPKTRVVKDKKTQELKKRTKVEEVVLSPSCGLHALYYHA